MQAIGFEGGGRHASEEGDGWRRLGTASVDGLSCSRTSTPRKHCCRDLI